MVTDDAKQAKSMNIYSLSLLYLLCGKSNLDEVMWWCYRHGSELAIHRSRVGVLAGHHCVVALGKLLTCVPLLPTLVIECGTTFYIV